MRIAIEVISISDGGRRKMKRKTLTHARLSKGAAMGAIAGALWAASSAKAAPVTFAEYEQNNSTTNANLFNYTEAGIAGTGGAATLTAVSIPVTFSYESLPGLPADLQGPQAATLTLTSATAQGVFTIPIGGVTIGQELFNVPAGDTLTITRNTPAAEGGGTRKDLLTMSNFTGELSGPIGGFTSDLSGQTSLGFSMSYASDFLDFTNSTVRDYSLGYTSWTSTIDGTGLTTDSTSGFYKTATAAGTGSFDAGAGPTVTVPEPATTILGLAGVGILFLRRRNKA